MKITIKESPDQYRGDLTCLKFDEEQVYLGNGIEVGDETLQTVFCKKTNEALGMLHSIFGNNGLGKLAHQYFIPNEGVEAVYE
jgi:hypothetical protein